MNTILFGELPGFSKLFVDFVSEYDRVKPFFQVNRFDTRAVEARMKEVADRYPRRKDVSSILRRQNERFGNTEAASDNAVLLASPNTLAVVTGQQMGFLGGPLFTVYKAMATIRWCRYYKEKFPSFDFVPIFWMEDEDHDFNEVRSVSSLSLENELVSASYDGFEAENKRKRPINRIVLDESIRLATHAVRQTLQPSHFTETLMGVVENAYAPGETMATAFARLMAAWLGPMGLVLCDPSDPELKKLAKPIFQRELDHPEVSSQMVREQSVRLVKAGYHLQVETQGTNLFLSAKGQPPFSDGSTEKIRITPTIAVNHRDWLLSTLEREPESFIPNVILRPVVQDFLLPTLTYIGGPSEIAYWAQFTPLYPHFNTLQPVVVPRPFITLLEKKNKRVLDKYGLALTDVFQKKESLLEGYVLRNASVNIESLFGEWLGAQEQKAKTVEIEIARLDASLKGAVNTTMEKIRQAVGVLKEKTIQAEKRSQEQTVSQISKVFNHLFPKSIYQERLIGTLYFLNKYDATFLLRVTEAFDLESAGMQVIEP